MEWLQDLGATIVAKASNVSDDSGGLLDLFSSSSEPTAPSAVRVPPGHWVHWGSIALASATVVSSSFSRGLVFGTMFARQQT